MKYRSPRGVYIIRPTSLVHVLLYPECLYVGVTNDFYKRYKQHSRGLKKGLHHSKSMQAYYNKHGKESLIFTPIQFIFKKEHQLRKETKMIKLFKSEWNTIKKTYSEGKTSSLFSFLLLTSFALVIAIWLNEGIL